MLLTSVAHTRPHRVSFNTLLFPNSDSVHSKDPLEVRSIQPKSYRNPHKVKHVGRKRKTHYCSLAEGKTNMMNVDITFIALKKFVLLVLAWEWVRACTGKCPRSELPW